MKKGREKMQKKRQKKKYLRSNEKTKNNLKIRGKIWLLNYSRLYF